MNDLLGIGKGRRNEMHRAICSIFLETRIYYYILSWVLRTAKKLQFL